MSKLPEAEQSRVPRLGRSLALPHWRLDHHLESSKCPNSKVRRGICLAKSSTSNRPAVCPCKTRLICPTFGDHERLASSPILLLVVVVLPRPFSGRHEQNSSLIPLTSSPTARSPSDNDDDDDDEEDWRRTLNRYKGRQTNAPGTRAHHATPSRPFSFRASRIT